MFSRDRWFALMVVLIGVLLPSGPAALAYPPPPAAANPGATSTQNPRARLIREHLWGNARFPQMNRIIRLRLMKLYLTEEIAASEFIKKPNDAELKQVAKAMNVLHQRYGVRYRSEGTPGGAADKVVTLSYLARLTVGFGQLTVEELRNAAEVLCATGIPPDKLTAWNYAIIGGEHGNKWEHCAQILDRVFTHPDAQKVAADLRKVGQVLATYLDSESVAQMSRDYLPQVLTTIDKLSYGAEKHALAAYSRMLNAKIRRELHPRLGAVLPDLSPNALDLFTEMLTRDR